MIIPNRSLIISNYTKLSYTMMSLLFRRKRLVFSDNNFQKLTIILSNNYYWNQFSEIIGNYCPRKMRLAASYKLFLFTYLRKNKERGVLFSCIFLFFLVFLKPAKR